MDQKNFIADTILSICTHNHMLKAAKNFCASNEYDSFAPLIQPSAPISHLKLVHVRRFSALIDASLRARPHDLSLLFLWQTEAQKPLAVLQEGVHTTFACALTGFCAS